MASTFMCGMEDLLFNGSRFVWNLTISTLRRWYTERLRACQQILRTWCGLRDVYQMTEGRHCQVNLLDGRKLELLVQPKLLSRELLDLVASHFNLKEKEYFGITFIDDTGQSNWLQLDRRVLDHDLPKKTGPVALFFSVKFYIENISFLKDTTTVELFFLNAKSSIYKGDIEVDSETAFELAAYVLQEKKGDYISDEIAREELKKLPALPTRALQEHPSLAYCYMTVVEALPTYGIHYYGVKDKQGIPWWLGIGCKGIGQYDFHDKVKPRKIFQWKQLENLYFREKKFAVEVHDPRRSLLCIFLSLLSVPTSETGYLGSNPTYSRVPLSRRTFGQTGLVVNTWYASTSLIKSIWVMAISQHQFYLDRKQSKAKIPSARSLSDIAVDLTDTGMPKASKLANVDGKNPIITASNGSLISSGSQDSEVSDEQKKEKLIELKQRRNALQDILNQRMEELKKICLREAELTGKLPKEYPQTLGEELPHVRRRVGTTFKLDDTLLQNEEDPYLQDLENKFVIQQKIVEAARKLANDHEVCKNVKKKRKQDYVDALKKLQDIENSSNEYRIKCGRKPTQRTSLVVPDEVIPSETSSLSDTNTTDDDDLRVMQRKRSFSSQQPLRPLPPQSLELKQNRQRRSSASEQLHDKGHIGQTRYSSNEGYYLQDIVHGSRELSSTHSSPYRTQGRQFHGGRSMPATPVMTRNAYSSSQLRSELSPDHFRQRRGSLESQSQLLDENASERTVFPLSAAQRSCSTELLDDGSSYTSQSSTECYITPSKPPQYYNTMTMGCRSRERRRHKKPIISSAASGSMPNLAPKDGRNGVYQNSYNQPSSDYYIPGYPPYCDYEPYGYTFENDTEGHYNVKAPYRSSHSYNAEHYRDYSRSYQGDNESMPQNPYATLRNVRRRGAKSEQITKNIQKALVAESLRGWYERASTHKDYGLQAGLDSDRGSQQSLGFAYMHGPFSPTSRATSFTSVSSATSTGTWRSQLTVGHQDYDHGTYTSSFTNSYSNTTLHSRRSSFQCLDDPFSTEYHHFPAVGTTPTRYSSASSSSSTSSSSFSSTSSTPTFPYKEKECFTKCTDCSQHRIYRNEIFIKYPYAKCSPR
ncbi:FERM domain-containing protein 4B-like isoform X2 [Chiloscyllium plagiosum]|uniref:FERM domain-containing protein 4B-like isoform X2 n=1 Tax=Chiloscyllium plagiosum TaxID=36176 RepID=UPI001CB7D987|nr:FERM domain-containing protein 4B-like isoform X2 [Chiloscyllium plagiosum]